MNNELKQRLINSSCVWKNAQTDFCVGDGWFNILFELGMKLNARLSVTCVKEKFGALRIYFDIDTATKTDQKLCDDAETASMTTCELCGNRKTKTTQKKFLIKTLCDECFLKFDV